MNAHQAQTQTPKLAWEPSEERCVGVARRMLQEHGIEAACRVHGLPLPPPPPYALSRLQLDMQPPEKGRLPPRRNVDVGPRISRRRYCWGPAQSAGVGTGEPPRAGKVALRAFDSVGSRLHGGASSVGRKKRLAAQRHCS